MKRIATLHIALKRSIQTFWICKEKQAIGTNFWAVRRIEKCKLLISFNKQTLACFAPSLSLPWLDELKIIMHHHTIENKTINWERMRNKMEQEEYATKEVFVNEKKNKSRKTNKQTKWMRNKWKEKKNY